MLRLSSGRSTSVDNLKSTGTNLANIEEVGVLAREMSAAHQRMMTFYQQKAGLSPTDADAKARQPASAEERESILNQPADQVSWFTLDAFHEHDPQAAIKLWEHVKREARHELESGHLAAKPIEWCTSPWERAQFLVMREAFIKEWQPTSGVEMALIDTMAQTHTLYMYWLRRHFVRADSDAKREDKQLSENDYWQAPRIEAAEAVEMSGAMAERFQKMFLRAVRTLRDLRRYGPDIVVQNAQQVNVGRQQINLNESKSP
jgi:hypothetical protein